MNDYNLEFIVKNLFSIIPLFHRKLLRIDELLANQEIAPSHLKIMFLLDSCEKLTISDIGRKLYISRPNVTPLIDKLANEGMVERLQDLNDKRIINIHSTQKGKEFIAGQKAIMADSLKKRLALLPDASLDELNSSLETLKDILSKIAP